MSGASIVEVIAERHFEAEDEAGLRREVVLRIGKPVHDPKEGGDWSCPYQIVGLWDDRVSAAYGVDPVQALLLSLQKAGLELNYYRTAQKGKLTWLGEEDLGLL